MPFPPLDAWDDATLDAVCASDETAIMERKAAPLFDVATNAGKNKLTAELAKQVCAFSNAGTGFLVFGVDKAGALDGGVPDRVGNQPVKEWVEQLDPNLVEPPVTGVRARFLTRPGHHQQGRGVLVVEVPHSDARPHWVHEGAKDVAYLRVGEHSAPMSHHTLLDMASRQGSGVAQVFGVDFKTARDGWGGTDAPDIESGWAVAVLPVVGLASGPVCRDWGLLLRVDPIWKCKFYRHPNGTVSEVDGTVFVSGKDPLLPGRRVRVEAQNPVVLYSLDHPPFGLDLEVSLYAGTAQPVSRTFQIQDSF